MKHAEWIGKRVCYVSASGRWYEATIEAIPDRPDHGYTDRPTVSLSFRDRRGKLVRKGRVIPRDPSIGFSTLAWTELQQRTDFT